MLGRGWVRRGSRGVKGRGALGGGGGEWTPCRRGAHEGSWPPTPLTCMHTHAHKNTRVHAHTCPHMCESSERTQAHSATSSRHFGHPLCKPPSWPWAGQDQWAEDLGPQWDCFHWLSCFLPSAPICSSIKWEWVPASQREVTGSGTLQGYGKKRSQVSHPLPPLWPGSTFQNRWRGMGLSPEAWRELELLPNATQSLPGWARTWPGQTLVLRKTDTVPGAEATSRAWHPWEGRVPGPVGRSGFFHQDLGLQHEGLRLDSKQRVSSRTFQRGWLDTKRDRLSHTGWRGLGGGRRRAGQGPGSPVVGDSLWGANGRLARGVYVHSLCSLGKDFFPLRTRGSKNLFSTVIGAPRLNQAGEGPFPLESI